MRVKKYGIFDIGYDREYFNDDSESSLNNKKILHKVANKCYLPANETLLKILKRYPEFRASFSITGTALEQFEKYYPEVLESFIKLVDTGRVEILGETYYHSLSFLYSPKEFKEQVALHQKKIKKLFNYTPRIFRNTELIYNNDVARTAEELGFKGIISEGADHILGWRSPNFLYKPAGAKKIKLLLKNYKLSDDIAFRFGSRDWPEFPLTAEKFGQWVSSHNGSGEVINLFMDYETFGEHQWADTGIFNFLEFMPREILKNPDNTFLTPSEAVEKFHPVGELDVPHFISWADVERDLSAWRSNEIQRDALRAIYDLEEEIIKSGDDKLLEDWRKLQTSDHFYYMCTKWFNDGDVHKYFNPYESPYEAFISFMNVVNDLKLRIEEINEAKQHPVPIRKIRA
jgi:alpha-amylase